MALLGGVRDRAQTAAYMDRNLRHWEEYRFGVWLLRDPDGHPAGRALLRHLEIGGLDEIEVGYSFHPEYWGRGLAPEIAGRLLQYGHQALGRSIVALTRPDNRRSQRVMLRIGMAFERPVLHEGLDHVLFRSAGPVRAPAEA